LSKESHTLTHLLEERAPKELNLAPAAFGRGPETRSSQTGAKGIFVSRSYDFDNPCENLQQASQENVTVNYGRLIEKLLKAAKYKWSNEQPTTENSPPKPGTTVIETIL
jgi:hypothetical protein